MDYIRIISILCVVSLALCQSEENTTDIENDLEDFTNSTYEENDNSNTKGDIFITRDETIDDSTTETVGNETSTIEIGTNFSVCDLDPCKNGGSCLEDLFNPEIYRCECKEGYVGKHCGVIDGCLVGDTEIACDGGYCIYSKDLLSRACSCNSGMFWDNDEKKCRDPDAPCFPNPCLNGGNCTHIQNDQYSCECPSRFDGDMCDVWNMCESGDVCENGKCVTSKDGTMKICSCNSNFYWNEDALMCEAVKPPCIPNPCGNNGQCEVLTNGDYNCTCSGYYIDANCTVEDVCRITSDNTPCGGHGDCMIFENSQTCNCNEGYYWNEHLSTCLEVKKPCFPNPCLNDGLCNPIDDSNFNCSCSEEYSGNTCQDVDFCVVQGGNAICGNATCVSDQNLEIFYCRCGEDMYFDFGSRMCSELDLCPLMSCDMNEKCVNSQCICKDNYKRDNNTGRCEPNFCASNPCSIDDMMCTEGDGIKDFYCSCKKGFSFNGIHCIEATCLFPTFNDCDQKCLSDGNSYTCTCIDNYFTLNTDNKTCSYAGNLTCTNTTCSVGTCIKEESGDEFCMCPRGFVEDDDNCVDMCTLGNLPEGYCPDDQCEATQDGFRCKCDGKYTLSADNVTCTNRRICQENEIGGKDCAERRATCVEKWGGDSGYQCDCSDFQVMSNEGICQDVCSIEENQRSCFDLGATCDVNVNGEKECSCPPLFEKPENGESCHKQASVSYTMTIPLDLDSYKIQHSEGRIQKRSLTFESSVDYFKIKVDVQEAMSKIFPELVQSKVIKCRENNSFYKCTIELQFKSISEDSLNRIKSSDMCMTVDNSPEKCLIPPSLVLRKGQVKTNLMIKKTNPCDEDIKEELCGSETECISSESKESYNCTCIPGFEMMNRKYFFSQSNSFTEICKDVDECSDINACPQYSTCINTIGSYECHCKPGYRTRNKASDPKIEECVEICNPNPCDHGSCTEKGNNDFECSCEAGFSGDLCDFRDSNLKRAQTNTIIVGAVLGGALLITIIIFLTVISRLKKKKQIENSNQMPYATEMTERRIGVVNNAYQ